MILIVSGAGGVGKGTVVSRLIEADPTLRLSLSWTTRARRPGEAEDAYVWVDRERFMDRVRAGGFLEWNEFAGNGALYGTPSLEAEDLQGDRDIVLEIDPNGAAQVKARRPDAVMVLLTAPSPEVQEGRLRGRGDDDAAVVRRLEVGRQEELRARQIADHVVVNRDVEQAVEEVAGILERYRAR
ncbi:MAG: guanylate kinase [Acidimicrobiales bacterium]